jgi:hypothetical protein
MRARETRISGNMSCGSSFVHFDLNSVNPSADIEEGAYTLTVMAASTCTNIPSDLQTRTYAATIMPSSDHPLAMGASGCDGMKPWQ